MSSKKTLAVILTIVLVAVGASLIGSGKFSQGRMFDFDPRGREENEESDRGNRDNSESSREEWGRGGGGGEGNTEEKTSEDIGIKSVGISPNINKKDYYRVSIKFMNSVTKPINFNWEVKINHKKKTTLAENIIPSTYAYYEFDELKTNICPSYKHAYGYVDAFLDPENTIKETDEINNDGGVAITCNKVLTRGMAAKLAVLGAGVSEEDLINPSTPSFTDVPKTHPLYKYIETAISLKFMSGNAGKTTFLPDDNVNRAEAAKLVNIAIELKDMQSKIIYFSDNEKEGWAYPYIQNLAYWFEWSAKDSPQFGKSIKNVEFNSGLFAPYEPASEQWFIEMMEWG